MADSPWTLLIKDLRVAVLKQVDLATLARYARTSKNSLQDFNAMELWMHRYFNDWRLKAFSPSPSLLLFLRPTSCLVYDASDPQAFCIFRNKHLMYSYIFMELYYQSLFYDSIRRAAMFHGLVVFFVLLSSFGLFVSRSSDIRMFHDKTY